MRITDVFLIALSLGVCGTPSFADPPYDYPDVSRRFVGVQVGTKEDIESQVTFVRPPSRKGVFVMSMTPGAPVEDLPMGSIISKVNSTPVDSKIEFFEAIKAAPADLPIELEVSRTAYNKKKRMYWTSPNKIKAKPMTYGSWTTALTERRQDTFLNEWIELRADLAENLRESDLQLKIELTKNGIGRLYWRVAYKGNGSLFINSVSIRVGDSIHTFDVEPIRNMRGTATVIEICSVAADAKGFQMIRDVAFGTGEVAVAFHGQSKTTAEPMTENGRRMFQVMALAYMERGGKGLENPKPAEPDKK